MASEQAVAAGSRIRLAAGRLGGVLLPVLACSLSLSTSLISIAALLILICWLIEGRFAEKCREIMANPVCLAVLAYMLLVVVGLLWKPPTPSPAPVKSKTSSVASSTGFSRDHPRLARRSGQAGR